MAYGREDTFYRFQDRVQFQIAYRGLSTRLLLIIVALILGILGYQY